MLSENDNPDLSDIALRPGTYQTRMRKMMSVGWMGQTVASLCWIVSVLHWYHHHGGLAATVRSSDDFKHGNSLHRVKFDGGGMSVSVMVCVDAGNLKG